MHTGKNVVDLCAFVSLLKIAADADRPSRLRGRFFLESHFV